VWDGIFCGVLGLFRKRKSTMMSPGKTEFEKKKERHPKSQKKKVTQKNWENPKKKPKNTVETSLP